ncbi:hypothetical protein NUW58_g4861 [Xylaria curta]|uniref:Uncharacterized protein n=1 Tax=Xylaria curta TaxID=42375 RepID=A0ACC1P4K1_9PEZI|nr:hypothetical protein NUW58_g4861 [Xylaria curta]
MAEQLILKGTLEGHNGWVTSLATSMENPNMLLSASRDKTLIVWNLTRDETQYGYPKRSLHGHSHIVSDCALDLSSPPTVPTLCPLRGTRLCACGYDDSGVDKTKNIVAISHSDWYNRGSGTSLGINMPNHAWCDQTITISANGKSTTALVHDICPGCAPGSIDVSEAVFETLFGGLGAGRETASWSFN